MTNYIEKGPVVGIRSWRREDAPSLALAINSTKVQDNLRDGLPYPFTVSDAEAFIERILSSEDNDGFSWAITADGSVVGSIGVVRKENVHRLTGELGYLIAEPYWGLGIATQAVRQVCSHVFENSDIIRIYAEPYAHNIGSCRVLEKAGFSFEGTLRSNAVKNGRIIDMLLYANVREPSTH